MSSYSDHDEDAIFHIFEETRFNLEQMILLVETHLQQLASEKTKALEILRKCLVDAKTPSADMFFVQWEALQKTHAHGQLAEAVRYLGLAREAVKNLRAFDR